MAESGGAKQGSLLFFLFAAKRRGAGAGAATTDTGRDGLWVAAGPVPMGMWEMHRLLSSDSTAEGQVQVTSGAIDSAVCLKHCSSYFLAKFEDFS